MGPKDAYDLVSAIKDAVPELPVVVHTHCTTGLAFMTYLKAVEAGADVIDTAISPFSGGTAQPATETLAYALRQLGYQVDLDDKVLVKMADFFKGVRADFLADGTLDPISMATDTQCLNYQIPGGMLSNLISQLKMMNAIDKLDEALPRPPRSVPNWAIRPWSPPPARWWDPRLCRMYWPASATRWWAKKSRPTAGVSTAVPLPPSMPRFKRRFWATPLW